MKTVYGHEPEHHYSNGLGHKESSTAVRSLLWRSPASRRDGRHIHFHAPSLPDRAIAVKMNRLDKPGQTHNTTGVVQREQRYR
jgi:hypothetical protein